VGSEAQTNKTNNNRDNPKKKKASHTQKKHLNGTGAGT